MSETDNPPPIPGARTDSDFEMEKDMVDVLKSAHQSIDEEISKIIVGQKEVIEQLLIAMLSGGHCLLTGAPGLAKTLLVSTLGKVFDLSFRRIQFTPDLMPSDITGTEILEENASGHRELVFSRGPIFANIILADEINRTPPKTQAALLEAMQEKQVTAAGVTFPLEKPFYVLATQNPIEMEGTYPLPEAQLDRFMFNIHIDYLSEDDEVSVVQKTTAIQNEEIESLFTGDDLLKCHDIVRRVPIAEDIVRYAVRLAANSRPNTVGLRHLALRVADVHAAVERLKAAGVTMLGGPMTVPTGSVTHDAGHKTLCYFLDPDGAVLELAQYQ